MGRDVSQARRFSWKIIDDRPWEVTPLGLIAVLAHAASKGSVGQPCKAVANGLAKHCPTVHSTALGRAATGMKRTDPCSRVRLTD